MASRGPDPTLRAVMKLVSLLADLPSGYRAKALKAAALLLGIDLKAL